VLINAALSLGATRLQLLREVILPAVLPNIITGFRVGAGFAFRGLIFAEIVAAKSGIGYLIFEGAASHQTARTIVGMIVMGLLWLAIDNLYLKPVERMTIERWGSVTTAERRE
jgi:NitT/TauT family transport system permease protein/taurine transport system permease protein